MSTRASREVVTIAEMFAGGVKKCEGLISTFLTFSHDVVILIRSVISIEGIKMPTIAIVAIHVLCCDKVETTLIIDRRGIVD
jgi:hypothetical protein